MEGPIIASVKVMIWSINCFITIVRVRDSENLELLVEDNIVIMMKYRIYKILGIKITDPFLYSLLRTNNSDKDNATGNEPYEIKDAINATKKASNILEKKAK